MCAASILVIGHCQWNVMKVLTLTTTHSKNLSRTPWFLFSESEEHHFGAFLVLVIAMSWSSENLAFARHMASVTIIVTHLLSSDSPALSVEGALQIYTRS